MRTKNLLAAQMCTLGVWLLSSECTQAFYNPSTGRWLNRDPIGERGGANIYAFVQNEPCAGLDRDGRDFVLRENFQTLPSRPREGNYTNYVGLTWFQSFEPVPGKNKTAPCCWKIFLSGEAELMSWHVAGNAVAELHEAHHINIHRRTFAQYKENAAPYLRKCFSEAKATCLVGVIGNEMVLYHLALYYAKNLQFDCDTNQGTCGAAAEAWREVPTFAERLAVALANCRSVP